MTTLKDYSVVEFIDGLALAASIWLNEEKTECAYPTFRDIIKTEKFVKLKIPAEKNPNWKIYDVIRVFYTTNSYEKAKQKLILAEDTSDLATDKAKENEKYDEKKETRHLRAQKQFSSESDCSFSSDESEETKLPPFPKLPDKWNAAKGKTDKEIGVNKKTVPKSKYKLSADDTHAKNSQKEANKISKRIERKSSNSDENGKKKCQENDKNTCNNIEKEDLVTENGFEKEVLRKLQLLLNKVSALENRMVLLETSVLRHNQAIEAADIIDYEEYNLPLKNMQALKQFEELLKNNSFADKVINTLKQVGGVNLSNIISNVLRKLLSDNFAEKFSYLGRNKKNNFSTLRLCSILKKVVRYLKPDSSDAQIAEFTSNWLVHAKWRQQRAEIKSKKTAATRS